MKAQIRYCLIAVFLFSSFLSAQALQSSPQGALEELATTEKFENFVKHLPYAVEQHIAQLSKSEREASADKLMVSKSLKRDGGTLTHSDSGTAWELMQKAGGEKV